MKHIRSKPPRLLLKYPDLVFARTPLSEIQSSNLILLSVLLKEVSLSWVAAFVMGYHQFSFYLEYEIFPVRPAIACVRMLHISLRCARVAFHAALAAQAVAMTQLKAWLLC